MFTGSGAEYNKDVPIYSFDGRDVLKDTRWLVSYI